MIYILKFATLLKKRLWHRRFPVNLAKFLRTPFFAEQLRRLRLNYELMTFMLFANLGFKDITNPYNCLMKNAYFLIKTSIDWITSYIIKQKIDCCFRWHKLFFCMILRQFTVAFKNAFSGLVFCKQKVARVFRSQENINVVIISTLPFTRLCLSFLKLYSWADILGKKYIISMKSTSFCHEIW